MNQKFDEFYDPSYFVTVNQPTHFGQMERAWVFEVAGAGLHPVGLRCFYLYSVTAHIATKYHGIMTTQF